MSLSSKTPTYNLKAVVQETGIKADTLRAWERRYGLPDPLRTPTGHRLYSQRDISTLKWLMERQREGLSISRAVALWERLEADDQDPLAPNQQSISATVGREDSCSPEHNIERNGDGEVAQSSTKPTREADYGVRHKPARQQWVSACFAFDEQAARRVIEQAFSMFSAETVCTQLLQHGLAKIGQEWEAGRATAQQEHFASSLAMSHIQILLNTTPSPTRSGRILLGCPAGEEHVFPALLLALFLRRRGWEVIYLGANVPRRSLEKTLLSARPDLVILVAQQLHTAASLYEMSQVLYDRRIPLAYGGGIFCQNVAIQDAISGYFLGNSLDGGAQIVEDIMRIPRSRKARHNTTADSHRLQRAYQATQPLIEAQTWQKMQALGEPLQQIPDANKFLGHTILAYLALKTPAQRTFDPDWLEQLLRNHYQMSPTQVESYLNIYRAALVGYLPEDGHTIAEQLGFL